MPAPLLPTRASVGTFLAELKRRKVYRTAAGYAAGAFIVWQAADIAFPALGLPATAMRSVVIFALAGFPVAVMLSWAFEIMPQREVLTGTGSEPDPTATGEAVARSDAARPAPPPPSLARSDAGHRATPKPGTGARLFGVGRGLRIGILSVVAVGCGGIAFTVLPRADLQLPDGNRVLIADLENHAGDSIFGHALVDALRIGLAQSPHLNVVSSAQARTALLAMRRDTSAGLDEAAAIEMALRESIAAVLVPSIQKVGRRYRIATRVIDPATGATLISRSARANGEHEVLSGLDELARQLRADLGESLASMVRLRVPLERATTGSLDALYAWTEGNRHYSAGRNDEALVLWERAVELDSTFALAHADLGQFYYWHRGDPLTGEAHLQAALRHSERTTQRERLMIQAKSAEWRGNREEAASTYRAVTSLFPTDVHAWGNLGHQYLRLGRESEAIAAYGQVVELDSTDTNALLNLATLHSVSGEYETADRYYRRAFELAPAYLSVPNLNHEYGLNLIALGQAAEAERVYSTLLDKAPAQRSQGLRSIAMLRVLEGELGAAAQLLRQAVVLNDSDGSYTSGLRNRGLLIESLVRGGTPAARELAAAYDLARSRYIPSFWVHHIGVWLARDGQVENATVLLDTARARVDGEVQSRAAIMRLEGEIALARGDTASAAERLEAALSLDPDWVPALSTLALIRRAQGRDTDAERLLLDVIRSRGHSPGDESLADWVLARFRLGSVYEERGDHRAARDYYDQFTSFWGSGDRDVPEIAGVQERALDG